MKTLTEIQDSRNWSLIPIGEAWLNQFKIFQLSAFRLEILQTYSEPSELAAFEAYKLGGQVPHDFIENWCRLVSDHSKSGKSITRVHLVDLPLSEYLGFEIECAYRFTSASGENIKLLDRATLTASESDLFKEDFWLFDDSKVMVQIYDRLGALMYSRISEDPEIVQYYQTVRDRLLEKAEPFEKFYSRVSR